MSSTNKCKDLNGTNFIVAMLIALFAINSWIGMNSIWVQLPLLVPALPEQWNLASYLTVIVQLANIAPLVYSIVKLLKPGIIRQVATIYVILVIGCITMLLVGLFWDEVTVIAGNKHSLSLMLLAFFLSLADCSSSVISLPYMSKFKSSFTTAYFVGLGLSSLIPSMLALLQGAGETRCVSTNDTNVSTVTVTAVNIPPLFSASTFFYLIFCFMIFCSLAFVMLNKWKKVETCYTEKYDEEYCKTKPMKKSKLILLLALNTIVCAFNDGVLDSIQTYTSMPYGILAYHLAAALSGIAAPLGCFAGFFVQMKKTKWYLLIAFISAIFCAYLLVLASMSPNPPLQDYPIGAVLLVFSWCTIAALFGYMRTCIAINLQRKGGEQLLFWCGIFDQVGSFLGAVVMFPLINIVQIFKSAPTC